ncbi:MAG: HD domain-containing protein [Spirochaetes bacterium]|nr:HD domain-containing protein [Spirochaetota bacterium]
MVFETSNNYSFDQLTYISEMFDSFGNFLILYDMNGKILNLNNQLSVSLDYSHDELISRHINDFYKPLTGVTIENVFEYLSYTDRKDYRGTFLCRNGIEIPVTTKATRILYEGTDAVLAVSQDVTAELYVEKARNEKFKQLRENLGGVIRAIANAVEARDAYTAGHQQRVSNLARKIAERMDLPPHKIEGIRTAASIHDIGKIAIPSDILSKTNTLLDIEFELIKRHTNVGFHILSTIDFPWPVAAIVFQHHEKIDGSGYPLGLEGDMMLIESKVVCVADVVEAMSTHRPYRPAIGLENSIEMINKFSGIHFEPSVVNACTDLFSKGEINFDNHLIFDLNRNNRVF